MTITYPLSLPTGPGLATVRIRRNIVSGFSRSPYTGSQYVQIFQGAWWEMDISLPSMKKLNIAAWRAFLMKLNGHAGTFLAGDPEFETPLGLASITPGSPVVDGAGQTGNTLAIKGMPLSTSGYLLAGDYIQIGTGLSTRLHMLVDDLDSDGSGEGIATLWPSLRVSPAHEAAIIVSNTKGLFRMESAINEDLIRPGPKFYLQDLTAFEAL